jgi:hypothetical protein
MTNDHCWDKAADRAGQLDRPVLPEPDVRRRSPLAFRKEQAWPFVDGQVSVAKLAKQPFAAEGVGLGLGAVALAKCGPSTRGAQARIDAALAGHGCEGLEVFLRNARLDWVANLIDGFSAAHAGTMPVDLVEAATR